MILEESEAEKAFGFWDLLLPGGLIIGFRKMEGMTKRNLCYAALECTVTRLRQKKERLGPFDDQPKDMGLTEGDRLPAQFWDLGCQYLVVIRGGLSRFERRALGAAHRGLISGLTAT
jgi:hypothetical protein